MDLSHLRRRCSECRQWFHAAPSALDHQRACGTECRLVRRRRLARRRRSRHVQDFRVDERERQRACRARRRAAVATAPPALCHAPASALNPAEWAGNLLASWDNAVALSRASLQRKIAVILRQLPSSAGTKSGSGDALSRAGLGL
jgi:hypothetical protein